MREGQGTERPRRWHAISLENPRGPDAGRVAPVTVPVDPGATTKWSFVSVMRVTGGDGKYGTVTEA
jgi:hypothetical protein